ncbi:MAG: carboxyl transferase domain-containing protein [Acidimicrobiia bacterium]
MPVLGSQVDVRSDAFKANREAMLAALDEIATLTDKVVAGGGEKYTRRHVERGKLLVRDRVELLLDRDSPFLELCPLAAAETDDELGAGVAGIGVIEGTECMVTGADPTVKGGATDPSGLAKSLRMLDIALKNRLPYVTLVESAGANLPRQSEIFVPGGATFRSMTRLSAAGVPTVSLVFGSSTAGGAYVPGMSDHTVFVKGGAKVFLGGPPLVKMAIDEDATEEELGGAEMHSRTSGLSDHLAADEADAIRLGRMIVRNLRWAKAGPGPSLAAEPPVHDPDELTGIVPLDVKVPFEVREVIARVVDGSRLDEFKPLYGTTLVTGYASVCGFPVGILANNGILFAEEARKAAQFIQLANRSDTPLLFLQNITGYMVGTAAERGGIIKAGAQMINAVSNSTVPHLTVMVGASYGAGNYGMAGRAYDPRFLFTWPNHRIAVMGGTQLAGVMSIIQRQAAERGGREFDEDQDAFVRAMIEAQIDKESTALYATGHLWDDGIVDPRETRTALGIALSAVHSAPVQGTAGFGVFRL